MVVLSKFYTLQEMSLVCINMSRICLSGLERLLTIKVQLGAFQYLDQFLSAEPGNF